MKTGSIVIEIDNINDWEKAVVRIKPDAEAGSHFGYLMTAAEYLTAVAAKNSRAGFEKAIELITQGAMKYKSTMIRRDDPNAA